jgi:hypothetical protein
VGRDTDRPFGSDPVPEPAVVGEATRRSGKQAPAEPSRAARPRGDWGRTHYSFFLFRARSSGVAPILFMSGMQSLGKTREGAAA